MEYRLAFCLCPGAPLISLAAALEVLRLANRTRGTDYYRWIFLSEDGGPVRDSNGLPWQAQASSAAAGATDLACIVAGPGAGRLQQPRLCAWLRRQARTGCSIGGISSGAWLLAASGLLDHRQATAHWEDFESFCLQFPRVRARYQRFVIDGRRLTCSGGTATLDLFIEIVRQQLGSETALQVARQMLLQEQSVVSPGSPVGRPPGNHCSVPVERALALIEAGVGQAITVASLAEQSGVSRRELLRLFRRELNDTPSQLLAARRLDRARSLVLNTRLPMATIADAVGFSSQSHLTSSYRSRFGITPAQQRREFQNARSRPPLAGSEPRDW